MIREYEKLSKKWKKVVERYSTLNYICLHYKEDGNEEKAEEYIHEMLGMDFMASALGYDLYTLLKSYEKWQKTHVEKE